MERRDESGEAGLVVEVLSLLREIGRSVHLHSRHLSEDAGLTFPQFACLKAIGDLTGGAEDLTVAAVAREVQLSPATVSRILDRLERADLVTRVRSTSDRRRVKLALTPAGALTYDTLPLPLRERFVQRLQQLDSAEQEALLKTLRRVTGLLAEAEPRASDPDPLDDPSPDPGEPGSQPG